MDQKEGFYPWLVVFILILNLFFSFVSLYAVPPLFSEIMGEIALTKTQMGLIMAVSTISAIFCTPIAGALSDKFGCRWVAGLGIITCSVFGALRYFVDSALTLAMCMLLVGAGVSALFALMPKVLSTWFPSKRLATVNGICFSSITIGTAFAMGTSAKILSPAFGGWRPTMVVISVVLLLTGIIWLLVYRDLPMAGEEKARRDHITSNFKAVLKIRDVWIFAIFNGMIIGSITALLAFLPITLQERGIGRAGEMVSIMLITSLVFKIIGGIVSDKVEKRKIFIVLGSIILGFTIPWLVKATGGSLIIVLFLAGMSSGPVPPTVLTAVVEIKGVGRSLSGTALGFILMVGTLGGSIGPLVTGKLMDFHQGSGPGFIFMSALGILGGLVFLLTKTK